MMGVLIKMNVNSKSYKDTWIGRYIKKLASGDFEAFAMLIVIPAVGFLLFIVGYEVYKRHFADYVHSQNFIKLLEDQPVIKCLDYTISPDNYRVKKVADEVTVEYFNGLDQSPEIFPITKCDIVEYLYNSGLNADVAPIDRSMYEKNIAALKYEIKVLSIANTEKETVIKGLNKKLQEKIEIDIADKFREFMANGDGVLDKWYAKEKEKAIALEQRKHNIGDTFDNCYDNNLMADVEIYNAWISDGCDAVDRILKKRKSKN